MSMSRKFRLGDPERDEMARGLVAWGWECVCECVLWGECGGSALSSGWWKLGGVSRWVVRVGAGA